MAGVELGSAFISVGLGTNKLGPEIKKVFSGLDGDAGSAGKKSGESFGGKFTGVLGSGAFKAGVVGAAAAVGVGLAAGFFAAVEGADANKKLSAQMGLKPEESERAGGVAGSLYAGAYGDSLTGVNDAVGAVMSSMTGMREASAEDLEDITAKALDLAGAFEVDVAEAATTAGVLMKSGLAGDADAAMDQITSAMQRVPAGVRAEVLPAMTEYSKHFAALGIDGDTAMGMIVAGADNGAIGMDKVGDAVKEFTIRATDMSKSTQGAYDTLGLNSEEMTNKLLAGGDSAEGAMGQIIQGLQGIKDPAEQSAASLALFGTPLEDLGTDQIPNFLGLMDPMGDKFDSTAGAAEAMGDTLNSGPGVALEELKRSVETTFMSFVKDALPALTAFSEWVTDNGWVIGALATLIGVTLAGAFVVWAAAVWGATVALLANPLTWIILGIVALIAALVFLVMNWDAVVAFLGQIWGGFINWLVEVMDGFVVWWNQIWGGLGNFIKEVWDGFIAWIGDVWNGFMGWIQGVLEGFAGWWSGLWAGVGQAISDIWNGIVSWVTDAINNVSNTISNVSNAIAEAWDSFWTAVGNKVSEIWEGIKSGVSQGIETVVSFVRDLPGRVLGFFANAGTLLLSAGRNIIDGFLSGLKSGFESVKNFVGGIGQWIADNKGPKAYDLALLVPAGGWIMDGLESGIEKSLPSLQRTLGGVSATIAAGVTGSNYSPAYTPALAGATGSSTTAASAQGNAIERIVLDVGGEQVFARIVRNGERKLVRA